MIPSQKIFFLHSKMISGPLSIQADRLLQDQKKHWPQLQRGYESLQLAKTRQVDCSSFSVLLQFNPARIVSTSARVDPQSIRERSCFLCSKNLPEAQKGILYPDQFLILCNPAPIFDHHFTISHVDHTPQEFESYVGVFLELARELEGYTVFYNGPKCGASAPDHMHFQACPSGTIPVDRDSKDPQRREVGKNVHGVAVFALRNYGRQAIVIEGSNKTDMENGLLRFVHMMKHALNLQEEPLLNALCSYSSETWTVVLFLRSKHRPEVYFKEGSEKIMISPAAADIGGFIVTPIEKDYLTVDANMVESIFSEVSLSGTLTDRIMESL
jgi:hypothetical protein